MTLVLLAAGLCCLLAAQAPPAGQPPAVPAPAPPTAGIPPVPPAGAKPPGGLQVAWDHDLESPPAAAPAFDASHAYVLLRTGRIAAVSLDAGKARWSVPGPSGATVLAAGDGLALSGSDAIDALSAEDGAVKWRVPIGAKVTQLVWDAGWIVSGASSGKVTAIAAKDGEKIWEQALGEPLNAPPALGGDRVYVPLADGRLLALALKDGSQIWEKKLPGAPSGILPLDDRLFVGSNDRNLYCLSTRDGHERWHWRTGGDIVGAPVVDLKNVYFTSLDNLLRALKRSNGNQRWKRALPYRPIGGPMKFRAMLLVAGIPPDMHAYADSNGAPAGDLTAPAELAAPPYLAPASGATPETLLILTGDGHLVAFRPPPTPAATN